MKLSDIPIHLAWLKLAIEPRRSSDRRSLWPFRFEDERARGREIAKALEEKLTLSPFEAEVLTETIDLEILGSVIPARKAAMIGLKEIPKLRAFCETSNERDQLPVSFVPKSEWPLRFFRKYLHFSTGAQMGDQGYFWREVSEEHSLSWISFEKRSKLFHWKPSRFSAYEEKRPYDTGRGSVPEWTNVYARGNLTAPTFDFIAAQIEQAQKRISDNEAVWIAISFPYSKRQIPKRHHVGPNGALPKPLTVVNQTRRLCIQLGCATKSDGSQKPQKELMLGEWIAVEGE